MSWPCSDHASGRTSHNMSYPTSRNFHFRFTKATSISEVAFVRPVSPEIDAQADFLPT